MEDQIHSLKVMQILNNLKFNMEKIMEYEIILLKFLKFQLQLPTFSEIFDILLAYCDDVLGLDAKEFKQTTTYLYFSLIRRKFFLF